MSKKQKKVEEASAPATLSITAKGVKYGLTVKEFRADGKNIGVGGNNAQSWATIVAALNEGPKTAAELTAAVGAHGRFVSYAIRRGWLGSPEA